MGPNPIVLVSLKEETVRRFTEEWSLRGYLKKVTLSRPKRTVSEEITSAPLGFLASRKMRNKFLWFGSPSLWCFVMVALGD